MDQQSLESNIWRVSEKLRSLGFLLQMVHPDGVAASELAGAGYILEDLAQQLKGVGEGLLQAKK